MLCSQRGQMFQLSTFKDDSSHLGWDCSAWARTYALYLEERLECFRTLKNDIVAERSNTTFNGITKVHCRSRLLNGEELLEQLPALQQLLYRLIGCQPEGGACYNYLIQYALALVLKESFKIYCSINDGIISLVDFFFEMSKLDAIKALSIYKRAGQQAEYLAHFYEFCRGLDVARTFQFPTLKQPPESFLVTMEEYIAEAPQTDSMPNNRLEYEKTKQEPEEIVPEASENKVPEAKNSEVKHAEAQKETLIKKEEAPAPISREEPVDFLGLNRVDTRVAELEETNAWALAIMPSGKENPSANHPVGETGKTSGWELALLTEPSTSRSKITPDKEMAGGFDKLLLDSLYEDNASRRQIQLQQAGYNAGYGYDMPGQSSVNHNDPSAMSNHIAPQTSLQMMDQHQQQQQYQMRQQLQMMQRQQHQMIQQQQQQMMQQHMMQQQQRPQQNMLMVHQHQGQYSQQTWYMGSYNPFGDPFSYPQSTMPPQGNHKLI